MPVGFPATWCTLKHEVPQVGLSEMWVVVFHDAHVRISPSLCAWRSQRGPDAPLMCRVPFVPLAATGELLFGCKTTVFEHQYFDCPLVRYVMLDALLQVDAAFHVLLMRVLFTRFALAPVPSMRRKPCTNRASQPCIFRTT